MSFLTTSLNDSGEYCGDSSSKLGSYGDDDGVCGILWWCWREFAVMVLGERMKRRT